MIDWEEIIRTESTEELKEAKLWLFQENMRLQQERTELEQAKDKFLEERVTLRDELDALNRRTVMERKRLKEESLFFEKKMAILQDGFRQLEEDRKKLEKERRLLREEEVSPKASDEDGTENTLTVVQLLFRGVNNPLALRKRYRDLIKIFHPDNLFGDGELAGQINKEYLKRKQEERFWEKNKPDMKFIISGFLKSNIIVED